MQTSVNCLKECSTYVLNAAFQLLLILVSPFFLWTNHLLGRPVKMYSAWHITEMQLNGLNSLEQITVLFWVDYIYACLDHLFHEIKMAQIPNEINKLK